MIVVLLIFLVGFAIGYFGYRMYEETEAHAYKKKIGKRKHLQIYFENPFFSVHLLRRMSYTPSGGADIAECLATAEKIEEGNSVSWYENWLQLGDRLYDFGKKSKQTNNLVSARECFLRSSNYFQAAETVLPIEDERKLQIFKKSRESFYEALSLFDFPFSQENIPYENTTLPVCIALQNSSKPTKTVIINSGIGGTLEEEYFTVGFFALKRGYNVVMFEGPGQGILLRKDKLHFRHDWEKVISPVLDYLEKINAVDKNKIALYGRSLGGYLSPRSAAYDKRIKALIVNSPIINLDQILHEQIPDDAYVFFKTDQKKFDKTVYAAMNKSLSVKHFVEHSMWKLGATSPSELVNLLKKFDLKDDIEKISCPTLVADSQKDFLITDRNMAKKFFSRLKCEKKMVFFTENESAAFHCQLGALFYSNEVIFNWLDNIFSKP